MADWSWVGMSGSIPDGDPGDVTLDTPFGVEDGDCLIAMVTSNQDGAFSNASWAGSSDIGFSNGRFQLFTRVAASEPASTVFDFAGTTTRAMGMMVAYRPANGVTPGAARPSRGSSLQNSAVTPVTRTVALLGGTPPWLAVQLSMGATDGTLTIDSDPALTDAGHVEIDSDDEPLNARFDTGSLLVAASPVPSFSSIFTRTGGATFAQLAMARVAIPYTGAEIIPVTDSSAQFAFQSRRVQLGELPHQVTKRMLGEPL